MNGKDKGDCKIFKVLMMCKIIFSHLCSGDTVKLVVWITFLRIFLTAV